MRAARGFAEVLGASAEWLLIGASVYGLRSYLSNVVVYAAGIG